MRPCARAPRVLPAALLAALAAFAGAGGPALERTLFKDIPSTDPAREVVRTVLESRFYSMRDGFAAADWTALGYSGAWDRARRYFPGQTYLVRPGTYFMTHGFDAGGRLFMEIHESDYLTLCVENRRTFVPGSIVGEYGRMLAAANGLEAAAFREKTGRLEAFFRDEGSHRRLRGALGERPYARLLGELREEDYHMLAGGLMHEGMHAGLDDALVARVQAEFKAGRRAVQWDELRAFTAEIGYHGRFCRWAAGDIDGLRSEVEGSLGRLEGLRKKSALGSGADRARFEQAKALTGAAAALIRLRMRETWQSARRVEDLAAGFRRDYVRDGVPPDVDGLLAKLEREAAGFVIASGEAIKAAELAVRSLEHVLDTWDAWAAGRRPFPPPVTDSRAAIRSAADVRWPEPDGSAATALMKRAARELE